MAWHISFLGLDPASQDVTLALLDASSRASSEGIAVSVATDPLQLLNLDRGAQAVHLVVIDGVDSYVYDVPYALDPLRALHLATAGGSRLLGMGDRVGALAVGQEADFVILDCAATPLLARRTASAELFERLFALQVLGDERAVAYTYVAGLRAFARDQDGRQPMPTGSSHV